MQSLPLRWFTLGLSIALAASLGLLAYWFVNQRITITGLLIVSGATLLAGWLLIRRWIGWRRDVIARQQAEQTVQRRDVILAAVSFVAQCFLEPRRWDESMQLALERLGQATDVSRVYVFVCDPPDGGPLRLSQQYEWARPGISPQIDNPELQHIALSEMGYSRWERVLGSGGSIAGDIDDFPIDEQAILKAQDIQSLVIVPIFVGRSWWGMIGFDECVQRRSWSAVEVETLSTVASVMGAALRREQIEHELRENEARQRALLNAIPDLMFRLDAQLRFVDVKVARDLPLILPPEQFLGQSIDQILPPALTIQARQAVEQSRHAQHVVVFEYQLPGDHGIRDYEARVVALEAIDEPEYVLIVRDITERKAVERLKNEFVSVVSHELRTPLTSIRGSLGLIASGVTGGITRQTQSMIDIALKNSDRLVRLINDILDLEKIEAGKIQFFFQQQPLLPLVQQAVEDNRAFAAQFQVHYQIEDATDGAHVNVDSDRMLQVITNLLSNAAKYSPPGESVRIRIEQLSSMVRLTVSDCGPGIPPEFRPRIFQKFAQADGSSTRQRGGTGLGLSIVKVMTERMHGHVWFTSEVGHGTTFGVDLPRPAQDPASLP
ncbi:MAG: hypothetical protein Fur005_27630 [Roseiflexaceae bacterium]